MVRLGRDVKLKDQRCPQCAELLDGATAMGEDAVPEPGDISVCCYCAEILQFDAAMHLVKCPEEALAKLDTERRGNLDLAQLAIKARRSGASLKPTRHQN
jgi:hypothetical protein